MDATSVVPPVSLHCALPLCGLQASSNVVLHPMPEGGPLRQSWITFVHRCPGAGGQGWTPPDDQHSFLCSLHFAFNSYVYCDSSAVKKCLRADAVPTIYPKRTKRSCVRSRSVSIARRREAAEALQVLQPVSRQCALPRCGAKSGSDLVFYPLPVDRAVRQAWINFVRQCPSSDAINWAPPKDEKSFLCSRHFVGRCFTFSPRTHCLSLRTDAVPSLYGRERNSICLVRASTSGKAASRGKLQDVPLIRRHGAQDVALSVKLFNKSKSTQCSSAATSTRTQTPKIVTMSKGSQSSISYCS